MINPKVNSIDIIKKSEAIFTITGTVGLEGLILKKPVIVLGSCYFKYCPLVIDAGDVAPTKWPQIIEKALKKHKHDEKILTSFLGAIFEHSFQGMYVEPLAAPDIVLSESNLQILCDQIFQKITQNSIVRAP